MRLALLPAFAVAASFLATAPSADAATCVDAGRTFAVAGAEACQSFGDGGGMPSNLAFWDLDGVDPSVGLLSFAGPKQGTFLSEVLFTTDSVEIAFETTEETIVSGVRSAQFGTWAITANPWTVLTDLYLGLRIGDRAGPGPHWAVFELAENQALNGTWSVMTDRQAQSPQGGFLRAIVWGNTTPIPLPPAALLLLTALGGFAVLRRRKMA